MAVGNLSFAFAASGINVVVVADGPAQHHSKKACFERERNFVQSKMEYGVLKAEVMQLVEWLHDHSITQGEGEDIKTKSDIYRQK